jgi:hypothetical protein
MAAHAGSRFGDLPAELFSHLFPGEKMKVLCGFFKLFIPRSIAQCVLGCYAANQLAFSSPLINSAIQFRAAIDCYNSRT